MGIYKAIIDQQIIKAATSIFDSNADDSKDETVEVDVHFGTLTMNKTEYEQNKQFYEEKEKTAIKEFSKHVTTQRYKI